MKSFVTVVLLVVGFSCCAFAEEANPFQAEADKLMEQHKKTPGFALVGEVKRGRSASFSINGVDFSLADDALVTGKLSIGKKAKVRGRIENGKKIATSVLVTEGSRPDEPENEAAAM